MKVLLINGSSHQFGCTYTALREVADTLEKNGVETEILWLGVKPMADCMACGHCSRADGCAIDDEVNVLHARSAEFQGLVVGSPVYYAAPSGRLQSFLDRLFYSAEPSEWAGKPGAAVVSCRRGGASAAFDRLNKYFTISNMPVVSSQYWNSVHGFTPEDVRRDKEGLQTMRTLGENMAWMLKYTAQTEPPAYEERVATHFSSIG